MNESPADITVGELVALEDGLKDAKRREASMRAALARAYAELSLSEAARDFEPPIPDSLVDEIKDALGM